MARATRTQPGERRSLNPRDQFGRLWATNIEIQTGDPTGGIFPAGWTDPLATPTKFVGMVRTPEGQTDLGRVEIQFERWIQERHQDEEQWWEQLHHNAQTMYKRLDADMVKNLDKDKFLLDLTGPKPFPSVAVLRKAAAGYRPFLGLQELSAQDRLELDRVTMADYQAGVTLTPEVGEGPPATYQEFVKWTMQTGQAKNLGESAALWRTHRELLNETAGAG